MNTPYFLIDKNILDSNILNFKSALEQIWPNSVLSYSVKTNSLPWLLDYLKNQGLYAEVVSDEEFDLAKKVGYGNNQIVFNGPIKSMEKIKYSLDNGILFNLDSKCEIEIIKEFPFDIGKWFGGLRVNVPTVLFSENDIGYQEDGFRFGFSDKSDDLKNAVEIIESRIGSRKIGLHLHCNSITRSVDVYKGIANYAVEVINKYKLEPLYIDIGGGFFGGVEGKPSALEYIYAIKEILIKAVNPKKTKLIVEPGSAIIGSAVQFHTSVLDAKETEYARIITTDGSRINIDPLWARSSYRFHIEQEDKNNCLSEKQIICGYTCMDHDRIMILKNCKKMNIGDKIIYERVGAYSMTFGGPFIRFFPEVYVLKENETQKIRSKISVEDYYNIHS